jgi:hypothetical protein
MYKFHQWYMNKLVKDLDVFNMLVRPDDFFREGEKVIRMRFKDICEVYHLDARIPILSSPGVYKCLFIICFLINFFWLPIYSLTSSFIFCSMKLIMMCKKGYGRVAFMNPMTINQQEVQK